MSHGHVVAANLLGRERPIDDEPVPSVVFTLPPLAMVGRTEDEASEEDLEVVVHHRETSGWYTSRRIGEQHATHKVLIERGSQRVVGAHLLGHGSEEAINLFALAMRTGMTASELKRAAWAYPTKGSDLSHMV